LNQKALPIVLAEIIGGWIGFLGTGWLVSRRPALGIGLFVIWQAVFWVCLWAVLVLLAPNQLWYVVAVYFIIPPISAVIAAQTYKHSAANIKAEIEAEAQQSYESRVTGDEVKR
jgi:hypothetical protein